MKDVKPIIQIKGYEQIENKTSDTPIDLDLDVRDISMFVFSNETKGTNRICAICLHSGRIFEIDEETLYRINDAKKKLSIETRKSIEEAWENFGGNEEMTTKERAKRVMDLAALSGWEAAVLEREIIAAIEEEREACAGIAHEEAMKWGTDLNGRTAGLHIEGEIRARSS